MPSDIPNNQRARSSGIGFSTVIVVVFLVALTTGSVLVMATGYIFARRAIDHDIGRLMENREAISNLVLNSRLDEIQQILEQTARNETLVAAIQLQKGEVITALLTDVYYGQQAGQLDVLFIQLLEQKSIIDVSTPGYDTRQLRHEATTSQGPGMNNRVFSTGPSDQTLFSVLSRREIITPHTGRLVAYIYGGVILNDNAGFLRDILESTGASVAALYHGDQLVVAFPSSDWQALTAEGPVHTGASGSEGSLEVFDARLSLPQIDGSYFHVFSGQDRGAVAELERNYQTGLFYLAAFIVVIASLSAWFLRLMLAKSLRSLSDYADNVASNREAATFAPSYIREFNEIGNTLEEFVYAFHDSEQQKRDLLDNATSLIFIKDLEGHYLFVNRMFENSTRISTEEIIGKTDFELYPTELAKSLSSNDKRVVELGNAINVEETTPFESGARTYFSVKFPLRNASGEINAVCGISTDITERKHLEHQLRQSQRMEAVGQLTGGVAHDFNNLLAVMIGNVEMLEDIVGENEMGKRNIEALIKAVERATSLTGRLLAFSRQQALSPTVTNITDLVGGLEDMLHRTLGETVELDVDAGKELWPATIDQHQFENALINLAINARDAMPLGGSLKIETGNVTLDETFAGQNNEVSPGDYVRISVSDSGGGIQPDAIDRVFEPFFTTKDVGEGSGLGLSMVYGFVKQSRGHVTIYSEVGEGTTVNLYLPRSLDVEINNMPQQPQISA